VVAIRMGPLAIAAVIGALYPAVTVLLARFVLRERLHGWQLVGIAMALVAVILTSWPG
jgi:drug/metabolite transporter (DMT)-like permease